MEIKALEILFGKLHLEKKQKTGSIKSTLQ